MGCCLAIVAGTTLSTWTGGVHTTRFLQNAGTWPELTQNLFLCQLRIQGQWMSSVTSAARAIGAWSKKEKEG